MHKEHGSHNEHAQRQQRATNTNRTIKAKRTRCTILYKCEGDQRTTQLRLPYYTPHLHPIQQQPNAALSESHVVLQRNIYRLNTTEPPLSSQIHILARTIFANSGERKTSEAPAPRITLGVNRTETRRRPTLSHVVTTAYCHTAAYSYWLRLVLSGVSLSKLAFFDRKLLILQNSLYLHRNKSKTCVKFKKTEEVRPKKYKVVIMCTLFSYIFDVAAKLRIPLKYS